MTLRHVSTSLRLAAVSAFALAGTFTAGCASHADDGAESSSESLTFVAHLPQALGGHDEITRLADHGAPLHVYPVGLPIVARDQEQAGGELQVMSNTVSAPTTFDISQWAPAPGNQGQTGSCAAWASGYSSMGWWANKTGLGGAPYAPMFLYAQEVKGSCEQGTSIEGNMSILQSQGIDTNADYEPMQRNLDCATQPTAAEKANAAKYKISGYKQINLSGGARAAIENALSSGIPVVLGIMAYSELMNVTSSSYIVGPPAANSTLYGGHAITAMKYDDNGVWILNSWSSSWGKSGWAELSWAFITGSHNGQANLMDAAAITGVVGGSPTPTPTPNPPPPSSGPTASFVSPANGSTLTKGQTVSIAVSASDPSAAISSASLHWVSPSGAADYALSSLGNGQWGITLQLSTSALTGTRSLTVTATDANGQTAQTSETLHVQ